MRGSSRLAKVGPARLDSIVPLADSRAKPSAPRAPPGSAADNRRHPGFNSPMQALQIHAGPRALAHIRAAGLRPYDIRVVAGAAGGPKGLILNHLDRHVFGSWLARATRPIHLVGASIGAWRMAAAAMPDAAAAFERLAHDYIHQHYEPEPGRQTPSPGQVSRVFGQMIAAFFAGEVERLLAHPRYRVHMVASRGRHVLGREGRWRTPLGYAAAALSNFASRRTLGAWLERVLFSAPGEVLPIPLGDLRHRKVPLSASNFEPALLASCSIPFLLSAVHDIPGAPPGAYWDGGITDYHLHWDYSSLPESPAGAAGGQASLVLYPHFQRTLVPGWLDKASRSRHRSTPWLDNVVLLAPAAEWVATLPNGRLPDRGDFKRYGPDVASRIRAWSGAVAESERLAEEWSDWLARGADAGRIQPL